MPLKLDTKQHLAYVAEHPEITQWNPGEISGICRAALAEIEKQVDASVFCRVNRKYLVNRAAIRKVSALPKSKLLVEVEPMVREELVVSSENSAGFKKWFGG